MNDEEDWIEPESGITLGSEEILRREIEKSKNLKVERLKLKDEIEKLRAENTRLAQKNQELGEEVNKSRSASHKEAAPIQPQSFWTLPRRLSFCLFIFNSCALAILLYFLLQK